MPRKRSRKSGYKRRSLAGKVADYAVPRLAYQGAKAVGKMAYNRYMNPFGTATLAKDVASIVSMINAEKKRYTLSVQNSVVGQVNGNSQGMVSGDITPIPAQGTTSITRNGNSIKLHSSHMSFQFSQQSTTNGPIRGSIEVYKVKGDNVGNTTTFFNSYFVANPFITGGTVIDYNSDINPDFIRNAQLVRKKMFNFPVDQISGQLMTKTVKFGLKYPNHHIRFQADGNNTPSNGQILLVIRLDSGNSSSSTASTLSGVPVTTTNTGLTFSYNIVHYFYDN